MDEQAGAWQTYLVEHYRPGVTAEELTRSAALIRESAAALQRKGEPVRFVSSTVVPADESFLCLFEAASERLVRDTYARAGITYERLSTAITEPPTAPVASAADARPTPTTDL